MTRTRSWCSRAILIAMLPAVALLSAGASAADAPMCRTFDRMKPCCPHSPPTCCPAPVSRAVADADVLQICGGGATLKGEAAGLDDCKRYYARGEEIGEVDFGRNMGDAVAFEKLRGSLTGPRALPRPATIAGATLAFTLREVDEDGRLERSSAWALVGGEIIHVEAERLACDEGQVMRLLMRALERVRSASATAAAPHVSAPAR